MNTELSTEAENPALNKGAVSGSSSIKKFRRGKKFQHTYFDIGNTNQKISGLLIEAESFERNGNIDEANSRKELAEKFKKELQDKYDAEIFDLDYHIPQSSGLYNKSSKRDVLKNYR